MVQLIIIIISIAIVAGAWVLMHFMKKLFAKLNVKRQAKKAEQKALYDEQVEEVKKRYLAEDRVVNLDEIDPVYFDKAYFVKPIGANKAYHVLLKAMESEKKAGIAKTVLGTKETLLLLRVRDGKMLVNTMYFHDEVQKAPEIEKTKITKQELYLAKNLINQMTSAFQPEKYKDEYYVKLQKAIKRKISGNEIVESKDEKEPTKIINLMEALQKSLSIDKKKAKAS